MPHGHTRTGPHTPKLVKPHRIFAHLFWARAFVWADGVERGWACVGLLTASRALRPCLRLSRLCFSLWNGRSRGAVLGPWSEFWRGCDAAGAGAVPCSKPNGPLSSATREVGMASPVLGSVRRTGRRPSTTPRAEASLTLAIASFRTFSVGRFPPHSYLERRSPTPASRRVLPSVALCSPRRASRPGLVRWAGQRITACPF